jgi:poly(3-hydroxybutyrate) depolymerase
VSPRQAPQPGRAAASLLAAAAVLAGCGVGRPLVRPQGDAGPSSSRQTARFLGQSTAPNGFFEYLPPGYGDGQLRPLLVFWHGIGEDGDGSTDLWRVTTHGPPMLIARDAWPASRPFVVLSPQHAGTGCPGRDEVHAFLAWAVAHYQVDSRRVYLTGLSCGAIGSWDYLGAYTGSQVAAAVLVAGDPGDPAHADSAWGRAGCGLRQVALAVFHGEADPRVDIAHEQATMNALLACPSPPGAEARWTPLPGGGHDVWIGVYDGTTAGDVYAWLLTHAKP